MICKECPINSKCCYSKTNTNLDDYSEDPCDFCKHDMKPDGCYLYCDDEECRYEPKVKKYRTINLAMKRKRRIK